MLISNKLSRQIVSYLKNLVILTMQNVNFQWFSLIKHLWITKVLFLSVETFRGHENSRNIKFNENQRGEKKKESKNRNEQNEEEHLQVK